MPPRTFALMLVAVILAAGLTILAVQLLALPWAIVSLAALLGVAALGLRRRS